MSTGSQDEASSGDSDEDEAESSSATQTHPFSLEEIVKGETLKAAYQKWRVAATSGTGSCGASLAPPECADDPAQNDATHGSTILALPFEVLLDIFRWAVGSHLDVRVLGRLAQVCHGFYLLSCDTCLWRSICSRQWPDLVDNTKDSSTPNELPQQYGFVSWKDMAIRRPHVLLDGCYLCRITYARTAEVPFTDICRQIHLVVYYRGIRFYPDGQVRMLTSAHPPNAIVAALGSLSSTADGSDLMSSSASLGQDPGSAHFSQSEILKGTYQWCDPEFLVCTLFRPRWKEKSQPLRPRFRRIPETDVQLTFIIRFRLASSKRRLHSILHWHSYEIYTKNLSTQSGHSTWLDVSSDQFPSCHFSPVRSYTAQVAPEPL